MGVSRNFREHFTHSTAAIIKVGENRKYTQERYDPELFTKFRVGWISVADSTEKDRMNCY